jgi:hypothetical protein
MLLTLFWVLLLIPIVIFVVLGGLIAGVCLYILACQLRTPLLSLLDDTCAYLFVEARVRRFLSYISHLKPLRFHQYYHGEQQQHYYTASSILLRDVPCKFSTSCYHHGRSTSLSGCSAALLSRRQLSFCHLTSLLAPHLLLHITSARRRRKTEQP